MSERLVVDSLMTADGEVVQLPTLGPLGPVDAQGGRIPLDTVKLFDAEGRFIKVESYELYDERLLPFGVQVYCPDNGGALRLTYDIRMQAAKSLREDSTLCLLWAMLMDSYSRWRTTWDVFNETGESCDL